MSKLVFFDVGDVLVKLEFDRFYTAVRERYGIPDEQFRKYFSGIQDLADRGCNAGDFAYHTGKLIRRYGDGRAAELDDGSVGELLKLRIGGALDNVILLKDRVYAAGHHVGIFSNTNWFDLDNLQRDHEEVYETYGGPRIFSCEIQLKKPDGHMYYRGQSEAEKLGADGVVLIEDNPANAAVAAQDFGWNYVWYTEHAAGSDPNMPESGGGGLKETRTFEELENELKGFGIEL